MSSCSLWRRNIVLPYRGCIVGIPDVVDGFGLMLLISAGLSLAGLERVGCVAVTRSCTNFRFRGIALLILGAGWNRLYVSGDSFYGPACIIRTAPCRFV